VNPQNFEATVLVRHSDVDLTVEATSTSQSWIDRVRPIGRTNDHGLAAALHTVHQSQKLSNNTLFDLTLGLFSVGRNGVNLIDEQNGWLILFTLFEGFPQIFLSLALHF
jgi:hypothetical protein